ncbi:phage tail sheath family protein [Erwinia oleae]|uniref:phage tail sheath family protein n=1 Tax=Erwinia oleae TaxID=796334 RepID=UPI00055729F4|nr:phage tail sheath family protein [Erwinia oleae]
MAMVLPGVALSDSILTPLINENTVATPLFMGFTPTELTPPLRQVTSLTEAAEALGDSGILYHSLRHFFDNGGFNCFVLSLGMIDEVDPVAALNSALQNPQLAEIITAEPTVSLLAIPEIRSLNVKPGDGNDDDDKPGTFVDDLLFWQQSWQALLLLCQRCGNLFALLDTPDDPTLLHQLCTSFSASNLQDAAAWWPALQTQYHDDVADDGSFMVLSPVAAVAAAIQCNDRQNGIWCAPANIALAKVVRPTLTPVDGQMLLNDDGIPLNLIRSFPGKGVRLWGCRTLLNDSGSPWRYIQTRLLVNRVEKQLGELARVYLFEPNNALTWMKLKGQAWNWLRQQWLAGAFYGSRESDAFSLSVGLGESMTQEDIIAGKMVMSVSLALLAPAEFIDIRLVFDTQNGALNASTAGE